MMKIKINIKELKKREKYITYRKHDRLDLLIWNYNHKCQYGRAWDEYTRITRGLITDLKGNIIARPFIKFFNLNEIEETKIENLPTDKPKISLKYDGSLGIQYYNNDKVCISTRGSFHSEQAEWATKWMRKFKKSDFKEGYTYLYEIIFPENKIIIDYGAKESLVLLAVKNKETGDEIDYIKEAERLGLEYATIFDIDVDVDKLINKVPENQEGFVLKYNNNFRIKIKTEEYFQLHKLIYSLSDKAIWEYLKNNKSIDEIYLNKVPKEIYNHIKRKEKELNEKYDLLKFKAKMAHYEIRNLKTRKEQSLEIMKNYKEIASLVFNLLDKKNISEGIWKMIKPKNIKNNEIKI